MMKRPLTCPIHLDQSCYHNIGQKLLPGCAVTLQMRGLTLEMVWPFETNFITWDEIKLVS
jgi:hypothetical protein